MMMAKLVAICVSATVRKNFSIPRHLRREVPSPKSGSSRLKTGRTYVVSSRSTSVWGKPMRRSPKYPIKHAMSDNVAVARNDTTIWTTRLARTSRPTHLNLKCVLTHTPIPVISGSNVSSPAAHLSISDELPGLSIRIFVGCQMVELSRLTTYTAPRILEDCCY